MPKDVSPTVVTQQVWRPLKRIKIKQLSPFCAFCRAAELMVKSGANVTLCIAKQGAIYHGLATLLNQPTPVVSRGMSPFFVSEVESNGS